MAGQKPPARDQKSKPVITDRPNRRGPKLKGPTTEEDFQAFESLCKIQCTLHEVAAFFNCDADTVEKRVREHYGMKFSEVFRLKRKAGIVSLRRLQYEKALAGNTTMLIWLGKQYLNQSEEPAPHDPDPIADGRTDDEIEAEIERRIKRRMDREARMKK
jgi:hypothetical protein